jgi:PTH2 family peptidyl-tRNA hydrolase
MLIRRDIKMTKGKVTAQCCHGMIYSIQHSSCEKIALWQNSGEKVITLSVPNEKVMERIYNQAQKNKIVSKIIQDAGHTQVQADTKTICVIGPDNEIKIDKLTKDLKLW